MATIKKKKSRKDDMAQITAPDLALVGNQVSLHPAGVEAAASPTEEAKTTEQSLLAPYARFRQRPIDALQELGLHISGTGWRSYDHIVGRPIFYPGFSENMSAMIMAQDRLQNKITELAQKRVEVELNEGLLGPLGIEGEGEGHKKRRLARRNEIEGELKQVAESWIDSMICKMDSRYFIRGAYYLASQVITRAYHQGIHVSSEEILRLRATAEKAERDRQSIVFLPCHRSHIDYLSLQVICYRLQLALPTVVAGDNLNFPLVGSFLQHAGAMYIRRSFGQDQLYATLVQSYMDTLLQNGHNVECFVEGGRSRTGKLLPPKFGILSFFLESIMSGKVEDAVVCPVSTQYDKVIEVDSYVSELLGQPKPKEDLAGFLSASSVLSLKLGRVDVRFHEPWSLRGFVDELSTRLTTQPSAPDGQLVPPNSSLLKRRILTSLGYKVLSDINAVSVIMPTALVGTVLLTLRGRGVGIHELVRRVDWLSSRVRAQGGRVAHFGTIDTATVVERALEVLGPKLVGRVEGTPEQTFYAVDRFQLSFYRNMTIHLFVSQAVFCAGVYTVVKLGAAGSDGEGVRISWRDLAEYIAFLSQLFRSEFIFPTTPLEENMLNTVKVLEEEKVVRVLRRSEETHSSGVFNVDGIESVELHPEERVSGRENFDFYCFLIWPFVEASWLGAISLFMLVPPRSEGSTVSSFNYPLFQSLAQVLGKTLYHQGDLSYFEAVNKEALKNAFARSEESGIIRVFASPSSNEKGKGGPQLVTLADDWAPQRDDQGKLRPEGRLWEFCERISKGRREGKNRRDGATVRTRVLRLVEIVGKKLVEERREVESAAAAVAVAEVQGGKRRKGTMNRAML
ncbi:acyltransferase-domain-containing protein [Polychaeton citri CBS 116435]|uniref:Acyltransferase-domain-containing protein n=1 Tax=Polychaeton citri CBS 116435 TaxID=1314669 RepID=A0A9P4QBC9_9PEZI|nr:acyltransferase-domain-containing protein [Polychaeton citri CBS 116435]